jgi:DNA-binding NarL/FixJ family response regulator
MEVVERVAAALRRGLSNKEIAYEHRISMSTVWRAQRRLAARHGCSSRVDLIARLCGAGGPRRIDAPLTSAERALVDLLFTGATNHAMASSRGVSVRTIANQLARLYRRLGIHSRGELAALLCAPNA